MSNGWGPAHIQVLTLPEAIRKRPTMYHLDPKDPLLASRLVWQGLIYALGAESARIDVAEKGVAVVLYRGMGLARMGECCPGFTDGHEHTPELRREMHGPIRFVCWRAFLALVRGRCGPSSKKMCLVIWWRSWP